MAELSKNEIKYYGDRVVKIFHPRSKPGIKPRDEAFSDELAAYQYFEKIRWRWAPKMVSYDCEKKQLELERIRGLSLTEMIAGEVDFDITRVVDQLVALDRLLWINRINCLQIKLDDILIEEQTSRIFIVDFEHTYLDSRFKNILYRQILARRMHKINDNKTKLRFVTTLKQSRSRYYKYNYRMAYMLCIWLLRRFALRKKGDDIFR